MNFYIFESGATKTDVLHYENGKESRTSIDGYNPNRPFTNFLDQIANLEIQKNATIYFYASGISTEAHKTKVRTLFNSTNITVENDLIAAARSTLGNQKGIVSINGTGANVGYYDGHQILKTRGGYGYLIDDLGGGLELGKLIISHWISEDFNETSQKAISDLLSCEPKNFVSDFYQEVSLPLLAKPCTVLPQLIQNDSFINALVENYFDQFVFRHVLPFSNQFKIKEIVAVGSIAFHFQDQLKFSLKKNGISLATILKKPIDNLLEYHLIKM